MFQIVASQRKIPRDTLPRGELTSTESKSMIMRDKWRAPRNTSSFDANKSSAESVGGLIRKGSRLDLLGKILFMRV